MSQGHVTPRQGHPDCTCGHPWSAHLPQAGGSVSRCTLDCLDGCREYTVLGPDAREALAGDPAALHRLAAALSERERAAG